MKIFQNIMWVLVFLYVGFGQASAQTSGDDIELRAQKIGAALRCVVCQNQSIDESNAPLAADMRVMVRERLSVGDSDTQVIEFMRERYGDFVLLKPPLQANTILLWLAPFALLFFLFFWYIWRAKHKRQLVRNIPLTEDERDQLATLSKRQGGKS